MLICNDKIPLLLPLSGLMIRQRMASNCVYRIKTKHKISPLNARSIYMDWVSGRCTRAHLPVNFKETFAILNTVVLVVQYLRDPPTYKYETHAFLHLWVAAHMRAHRHTGTSPFKVLGDGVLGSTSQYLNVFNSNFAILIISLFVL